MQRSNWTLAVAGVTLATLIAACGDTPTPPREPARQLTPAEAFASLEAQTIARGIAMALGDEDVRASVHRAMRRSRWMDHKLTLQDFVRTREGGIMFQLAAEALGTPRQSLDEALARMPALDFYVPFLEHRLSWTSDREVLVAATFDGDAPQITATDARGTAHTLRLADGTPRMPLVILHPAEPRFRIPPERRPRATEAYNFIQDEPYIGSYVSGEEEVCSIGDVGSDVAASCGGGGSYPPPPPPPPQPGVYVTHFHSFRGDGWFGSLEMEFRSFGFEGQPQFYPDNGVSGRGFWVIDSCPKGQVSLNWEPHRDWNGLLLMSPGITNVGQVNCNKFLNPRGYGVWSIETDGGLNGSNDLFGVRFFAPGGLPFGGTVGANLEYREWSGTSVERVSNMLKTEYR